MLRLELPDGTLEGRQCRNKAHVPLGGSTSAPHSLHLTPHPPPLPGRPSTLTPMCDELSCIDSVSSWSVSCALPDRPAQRPGGRTAPRPDADG